MKKRLDELLNNAYGAYSDVKVSAVAVTASGEKFDGVNVENAAYPSSICAERTAIFTAVTNGAKPGDIREIHLTSNLKEKNLLPCAACLQVMSEFMPRDGKIFAYHKDEVKEFELKDLLPYGVTKESFEWK